MTTLNETAQEEQAKDVAPLEAADQAVMEVVAPLLIQHDPRVLAMALSLNAAALANMAYNHERMTLAEAMNVFRQGEDQFLGNATARIAPLTDAPRLVIADATALRDRR